MGRGGGISGANLMGCYISHLQPGRPLVTPSVRSGRGVSRGEFERKGKSLRKLQVLKGSLSGRRARPGRGPLARGLNLTVPALNSGPAGVGLAADEIALRGEESWGGDNELWKSDFHLNIISLAVSLLVLEKQFHQKSAETEDGNTTVATPTTPTRRCAHANVPGTKLTLALPIQLTLALGRAEVSVSSLHVCTSVSHPGEGYLS